jgi:subtilisin family serine protease
MRPTVGSIAVLALTAALALPAAGVAASGRPSLAGLSLTPSSSGTLSPIGGAALPHFGGASGPSMTSALMKKVQAHPNQTFKFIVLGSKGAKGSQLAQAIGKTGGQNVHAFTSIPGAAATISGAQLQRLALMYPKLLQSVTLDKPVKTADYQNAQMWTSSSDVSPLWSNIDPNTGLDLGPAPQAPTIAFIDSGIDATDTADFGNRILKTVTFCSLCAGATPVASAVASALPVSSSAATLKATNTDGEGHGTMVAGIAAGSSSDYPGVAQNAPIVSVKVADANGESMESDVIAACDWILANKGTYGIKVVNISMAGTSPASFQYDPLDQAVQRLWFAGVTVVAASGNDGTGSAVDMSPAPGNDPFIITVGAVDQNQTSDPSDDTVAPWSAYGYTADGFSKPDLVAPGRYMIMPVPMGATIPETVPDRVVAPGYMWMSGTSFASPVVAGAAAQILARHPDWTPDEVKGALLLTAAYLPNVDWQSAGVGEVDAAMAASLDFTPPNPNENLDAFVSNSPTTGQPVFDSAAWADSVATDAAWSSAAWSSAAWASAAWASAAWASAAWSSAAWSSGVSSAMTSLATYTEATYTP